MMYNFHSVEDIYKISKNTGLDLLQICIKKEIELTNKSESEILAIFWKRVAVMEQSIKWGLKTKSNSTMWTMWWGDSWLINHYLKTLWLWKLALWDVAIKSAMYSIANNENNACMWCIVACPTAWSSWVVPWVFFACKEKFWFTIDDIIKWVVVWAWICSIIAENATISWAEWWCQAEIWSAVAMASSWLTYIRWWTLDQCINSASLWLKNLLWLACDPIWWMVEVPCIKRNAFGAIYSIFASDLAIMWIKSVVPFDEIVETLRNIWNMMPAKIRETALWWLAITPTWKSICKKLWINIQAID